MKYVIPLGLMLATNSPGLERHEQKSTVLNTKRMVRCNHSLPQNVMSYINEKMWKHCGTYSVSHMADAATPRLCQEG